MTINLEPREVTVVLQALSEKPYKEVSAIIHKIAGQITDESKDETNN